MKTGVSAYGLVLALTMIGSHSPAFAQMSATREEAAISQATAYVQPDLSKTIRASLGERLAALEERVLGLEHPIDSLISRTDALEQEVFGWTPGAQPRGESVLPERISSLESAVYAHATREPQSLPDGMSTFVAGQRLKRAANRWLAAAKETPAQAAVTAPVMNLVAVPTASQCSVAVPTITTPKPKGSENGQAKYVNPYATPGRYSGYPYIYKGPGLPPAAYGAYPGSATWFNSPYRQSGELFYTNAPYFPWAANRNGTNSKSVH